MRKGTAGAILLVGTIILGAEVHERATMFTNDNIWKRQSTLIERTVPGAKKAPEFERLRKGLDQVANASAEEKCIFEKNSRALLIAEGNQEEATKLITNSSYEPYAECKPSAQISAATSRWYTWAGLGAVLIGVVGLIRKER